MAQGRRGQQAFASINWGNTTGSVLAKVKGMVERRVREAHNTGELSIRGSNGSVRMRTSLDATR